MWHLTIYQDGTPKHDEIDLFVLTWQHLHGTFLSEKKQVTEQYVHNSVYVKRITAMKVCVCVPTTLGGEQDGVRKDRVGISGDYCN